MDYTHWVQMQQSPNPNSNFSLIQTTNHSAGYSHNLASDPYQPSSIEPHNALFAPQPRPPGVDPPYLPPPATVNYAQQPIGYEAQPPTVIYAGQPIGYESQPANVNYAQQSMGYESQHGAEAAATSYYPDPNVSWAAAILQIGATPYAAGLSTSNPTSQLQKSFAWKKGPKKTKVVQSAWCEVCKIDCNSKGVLDQHKLGKKHLKNVEKLKPKTAPMLALAPTQKTIIGPEENLDKPKSSNAQKARKKAAATEDLETKRRKVLEGGAAAGSVRACSICNVVCNSDTVFNYHLAGQKHASMIKKHGLTAGVALAM